MSCLCGPEGMCGQCSLELEYENEKQRQELARKDAEIAALQKVLEACRDTFKRYANSHRAKGTPEGEEKARSNDRMFRMCDEALRAKE